MTYNYRTPEEVIASFGTSLAETRALVPELQAALKRKQKYPFLPAPIFLSQAELASYGIELEEPMPEGWLLKITPGRDGGEVTTSFITPEKWEIQGEDLFISPEGKKYTKAELEALTAPGPVIPPARQFRMAVEQGLIPEGSRFLGIEDGQIKYIAPGATTPKKLAEIYGEQELYRWTVATQYEAHEAMRAIFPEEAIDEILAYAQRDPEGFVGELLEVGRTEETETILKFFGASEAEIGEFFGKMLGTTTGLIAQASLDPRIISGEMRIPQEGFSFPSKTVGGVDFTAVLKPDGKVWWGSRQIGEFNLKTGAYRDLTREAIEAMPTWARVWGAGWGTVAGGCAGVMRRIGNEGAALFFDKWATELQSADVSPDIYETKYSDVRMVSEAGFWYGMLRSLPFTQAGLIAGGGIGAVAGGAIGTAAGATATKLTIAKALGFGFGMAVPESLMEGGIAYNELLTMGYSKDQADEAFDRIVLKNIPTIAATESVLYLFALSGVRMPHLGRITGIAAKVGGSALSEGSQEVLQDIYVRQEMGVPITWDKSMLQQALSGAMMGLIFATGGNVLQAIQERSIAELPPGLKRTFETTKESLMKQGISEQQATLKALDEIAKTPEGAKVIERVVKEMQAEEVAIKKVIPVIPEVTIPKAKVEIEEVGTYTQQEIYQMEQELAGLKEWLSTEPAVKLVGLIKKTGWHKGEVSNLTLKQYRDLTGKTEISPNILTKDKRHVRWEYALDDAATELGYRTGEELKTAIEQAGEAQTRVKQLTVELSRAVPIVEEVTTRIIPPKVKGAAPRVEETVAPPPKGTATSRIFDRIQVEPAEPGVTEKMRKGWHTFNVKMVDDLYAIKKFTELYTKGGVELSIEENPYLLARLLRGITGKANVFLEQGTFGKKFWKVERGKAVPNFTGESLESILKEVKDPIAWRDFSTYLVARRAFELSGRNIKTGIEMSDALAAIEELDNKYKKFDSLAKRVYKYQDNLLVYCKEMGLISEDLLVKLRKYGSYVPFYRVFNELQARGFMGKKLASIARPIKRIKGSEREIINPLESIVKNTYVLIGSADRNQVGIMMANLVDKNPELVNVFERVKTPIARVARVNAKELGVEIEGLSDEDAEAIVDIFRPSFFIPGNEVTVLIDGKKAYFKVDPDLRDGLLNLDREHSGMLWKFLSYPAKWLRAGATLSPDFMVRNPARDAMTAFAYSNYNFLPGIDFLRGLAGIIRKDADYQLFKASGAEHSMMVSMDREYLHKSFKEIVQGKKFTDYIKHPLELFQIISELGEKATRLGEFKAGIRRGAAPLEAGYSARSVTLDFAQAGTTAHAINRLIAFFNANLRGWGKMYSSFREHPVRTSFKVFCGITLPSILLYFANRDDPRWKEIPQWQKDLFWIVFVGDNIYRIPKPFELGIIFGSIPERFLEWLDNKDPKLMKDVWKNLVEAGSPGYIPTAFLPIIEWLTNYNFFRGQKIVPASREKMPPELQYTRWSSEVAKKLGELLNLPPAKIDNLINGWTGGLGRYAIDILDGILKRTGISPDIPMPSPTLADIPAIKAFIVRNPYGSSGATVERFYELLEQYEQGEKYLKEMLSLGERDKFEAFKAKHPELLFFYDAEKEIFYSASARYLRQVGKVLSDLGKKQDEIYKSTTMTPEEKRAKIDEIDKLKTEVARKALDLLLGKEPQILQYKIDEAVNTLGQVIEEPPLLSIFEPEIYDMRDLRRDFGNILEAVTKDDLAQLKDIDPLAFSYIELKALEKVIEPIVNKKIYNLELGLKEGYTFEDYYSQWQSGLIKDSPLDNLSRHQIGLLREYYKLDKKEQEAFLEENPELDINPREEWLIAHPKENALLAIWGQARILTREAYDEAQRLIKELDIPNNAIPSFALPPVKVIEQYFKHNDIVAETSGNSIESKYYLLTEGKDYLKWMLDEGLRTDDLSDESVKVLKLRIDFKDDFAKYDAFGDRTSPLYIANDSARADKRQQMLFAPDGKLDGKLTDFGKAYYTKEAYTQGYSEENWEKFVEYSELPTWGDWRERFLLNPANKSFYDEWVSEDVGAGHPLITEAEVSPVKRDEIYLQFKEQFDAWDNTAGMTEGQIEDMRVGLDKIPGFKEARYRVEAYDIGFPEPLHDDYVEWYLKYSKKPKGYEGTWYDDDRWLIEHPEFHQAMVDLYVASEGKSGWKELRDLSKVPSEKLEMLLNKYFGMPTGDPGKLAMRCESKELDNYLVNVHGYTPCYGTYRCGIGEKPTEPTAWEVAAEAQAIKDWMEKQLGK